MLYSDLHQAYRTFFGKGDALYQLFAPYRICPLGAHVDHQHGLVSGFAFDSGIEFLFSATDTGKVEMASLTFEGLMTFNVQRPVDEKQGNWGDYLRGAVWALQQDFRLEKGIRGIVRGSMPIGGLSSSAALLCGFVMAVDKVNHLGLSRQQVIDYASIAERQYVGLNNGILDQACVVLCEADKLLFLDTETGEHRLIPFGGETPKPLPFKLGIFFSGVTRKLTGTDYNLRVAECKTAAWIMQAYEGEHLKELPDTRLRDVPEENLEKYADRMPERFARRARHFFTECDRVMDGVKAWEEGDIERFGQYVFESCESSMNNYECGSPELIALYRIMRRTDGIFGGRFSGAGFKGACIALVDPAKLDTIRETVTREYLKEYPQYKDSFEIFFCNPANGVDFL
ncbi:galactokinase family protein [uncultured Duncaniella sp.]|uniref:GHMP family kinase ATP-binding protein n=1 Tax=uncultured Duncaniella sp. TaxID=2768039 RepID=UPI00260ACBC1|nr:galactokinase family protein [uncultured Duncaniella sp.]